MRKVHPAVKDDKTTKRGYNEKNPGQPHGAFPPASTKQLPGKTETKSNAAAKKAKEDEN